MSKQWHRRIGDLMAIAGACVLLAACGSQGSVRVPAGIDLSGQWHLNEQRSDSVEAVMASIRNILDPPPRRGMPPPGTEDSGRVFSRRDEFVGPPRTKEMVALLKLPAAFSLAQSARSLTMKSVDGTTEYVYGEAVVVSVPDGLADRRCGWVGEQFVVDVRAVDGRKINYLLGLSKDRVRLDATITVTGGGLPTVTLKRSYDRDAPT